MVRSSYVHLTKWLTGYRWTYLDINLADTLSAIHPVPGLLTLSDSEVRIGRESPV